MPLKKYVWDAVCHVPKEAMAEAIRLFEDFTSSGLRPVPRFCVCQLAGSRRCKCDKPHLPAEDHVRCFQNRNTKERVLTISPYFNLRDGEPEIRPHWTDSEHTPWTLAQFKTVCEEFAAAHGLTVKISDCSWYFPSRTILCEYRKQN